MAKMPKPLPVTVVKFDQHGNEVAVETIVPEPDYKKRMKGIPVVSKNDGWMPDEVRCDRRVMGKLKKGGTTVLGYAHRWNVDEKVTSYAPRLKADVEEVYVEMLPDEPLSAEEQAIKDLRERRMAELYPKASTSGSSNGQGRTMTDKDAYEVKFGNLKNVKVSEAARALGLTYGQVYSAKNGYTFKHVTER